jgi:hypothetical protein
MSACNSCVQHSQPLRTSTDLTEPNCKPGTCCSLHSANSPHHSITLCDALLSRADACCTEQQCQIQWAPQISVCRTARYFLVGAKYQETFLKCATLPTNLIRLACRTQWLQSMATSVPDAVQTGSTPMHEPVLPGCVMMAEPVTA